MDCLAHQLQMEPPLKGIKPTLPHRGRKGRSEETKIFEESEKLGYDTNALLVMGEAEKVA